MKTCTSCGRVVDDVAGLELTDGRFFCQEGGCQHRFLVGVFERDVRPDLLRQNAAIHDSSRNAARQSRKEWWQFWKK